MVHRESQNVKVLRANQRNAKFVYIYIYVYGIHAYSNPLKRQIEAPQAHNLQDVVLRIQWSVRPRPDQNQW